jgi:glycosyltransferase involved in cell wall biosynthesis
MKLLFITRKYPPMVGGMEKVSWALAKEFSRQTDTTLLAWGRSQKYLPFVLPFFLLKSLFLVPMHKITHVHLGDALLAPLGLILKTIFKIKVSVTVHGLDITYPFEPYQIIVPQSLSQLDRIICVSRATMFECQKRWIPHRLLTVIPNGIYPEEIKISATRSDLEKVTGTKLKYKKVLLTVGRLVKRKGVFWFIENVLPKLGKNYIYIVVGEGPERGRIETLVHNLQLQKQVLMLGKIPDHDLKVLYNTADLFIMPNIHVPGDMEGFGTVALEASCVGMPVIASNLEGISDAVIHNSTGLLVESTDDYTYVLSNSKLPKKTKVISETNRNFSWKNISRHYLRTL